MKNPLQRILYKAPSMDFFDSKLIFPYLSKWTIEINKKKFKSKATFPLTYL